MLITDNRVIYHHTSYIWPGLSLFSRPTLLTFSLHQRQSSYEDLENPNNSVQDFDELFRTVRHSDQSIVPEKISTLGRCCGCVVQYLGLDPETEIVRACPKTKLFYLVRGKAGLLSFLKWSPPNLICSESHP